MVFPYFIAVRSLFMTIPNAAAILLLNVPARYDRLCIFHIMAEKNRISKQTARVTRPSLFITML